MKHKQKKPLWFYLTTGFLIFSVLLLVVLWLFQTVFLESFYKSVKTGQVKSCTYSIADRIDSDDLGDTIADIEEQNAMSVAIYNTDSKFFKAVYLTKDRPEMHSMVNMQNAYELYDSAKENNGEYSRIAQNMSERKEKRYFNNQDNGNYQNDFVPAPTQSETAPTEASPTAPTTAPTTAKAAADTDDKDDDDGSDDTDPDDQDEQSNPENY